MLLANANSVASSYFHRSESRQNCYLFSAITKNSFFFFINITKGIRNQISTAMYPNGTVDLYAVLFMTIKHYLEQCLYEWWGVLLWPPGAI